MSSGYNPNCGHVMCVGLTVCAATRTFYRAGELPNSRPDGLDPAEQERLRLEYFGHIDPRDDPDPLRVPTDVDQAYADGFADAWEATKPRLGAGVWLGCLLLVVAIAAGIAVGAFVIAPILAAHG
jgi:hypothetical protein